MLRIGITGVPGAGKTTLARALASKCRSSATLKNIELVSEYARRYISKHGAVTSIMEQYRILEKQQEWEDSVCNDMLDIMITDSPIFLGFIYCCELMNTPPDMKGNCMSSKDVMYFNDTFKKMSKLNYPRKRYDIIFHLPPKLQAVDDGVRSREQLEQSWREENDSAIVNTFRIFRPRKFFIVNPVDLADRVSFCFTHLINEHKDMECAKDQ